MCLSRCLGSDRLESRRNTLLLHAARHRMGRRKRFGKFFARTVAKLAFRVAIGVITAGVSETVLLPLDIIDSAITVGHVIDFADVLTEESASKKRDHGTASLPATSRMLKMSRRHAHKADSPAVSHDSAPTFQDVTMSSSPAAPSKRDWPAIAQLFGLAALAPALYLSWRMHQLILIFSAPEPWAYVNNVFTVM